jgi:ATP-binding cassette subfamily B protein
MGIFLLDMLCALVVAAITLILPLGIRHITKNVLESNAPDMLDQIYLTGGLMLVLILIYVACSYFVDYRGHVMGAMMESDLRSELFEHYQKLSFRFYDEQRTGQLMSRITNDLFSLAELYHHGPEDYVIYLVKFVGAFVILLTINVELTLAVFLFLPFMLAFWWFFNRRLGAAFKNNRERIGDINAQVEDNLSGIRVVKSFANEETEKNKFAHDNQRFLESRKTIYRVETFLWQGMELFAQLVTLIVVVYGSVRIINSTLDLPDLLTFLLYIGNFFEPIQKLSHVTEQYQEGISGFNRFMEIMEIEPDIQDAPGAIELTHVQGNVEFYDVGFRYNQGHACVLKNVNLKVDAGETIALVGSSGVGKTTLCSLIPRFYDVTEGRILLDGLDVRQITLHSLRRNVGVVQQDVYLFAGTVLENIRYGKPGASAAEIVEAARKADAHEFITALPDGYDTYIGQRGVKLSGGQKQRLSIARVFLKNPPVLIFDEATSALDNESERAVQKALEKLAHDRTTFIIAHRLSTIRNARRIVVLTDRGIGEQGSHAELMALGGEYARLYNLQFEDSLLGTD